MSNHTLTTVSPKSTVEERQFALTQIYRQVLERQPYASEQQAIASLERDFLKNKIGVRRFLNNFGCSDIYLDRFYYRVSNVKFLDVCFKHFLGRAILDREEMSFYSNILSRHGIRALIDAILDSEEYRKTFGNFTVPYARQSSCYNSPEGFLESKLLNEEHFGERGKTVPTIYWRQLGLICMNGVCDYPAKVTEPQVFLSDLFVLN
jgi:phycoerythrin-associated linker protein